MSGLERWKYRPLFLGELGGQLVGLKDFKDEWEGIRRKRFYAFEIFFCAIRVFSCLKGLLLFKTVRERKDDGG
jgi:hypothetical protein